MHSCVPLFHPLLPGMHAQGPAFNHILKVPEKFVNHIVEIGQCLHNVSLMVDDICDDTDVRRGG